MRTRSRRLVATVLLGVGVVVLAGCGTADVDPASASARGVVSGKVTAGPTCPVERIDQACPPQPVRGTVRAIGSSGRQVGATRIAADGGYSLGLPAGRYQLKVDTGSAFPHCPTMEVRPVAGGRKRVDINCDTGIR